jgi:hypothetical protein
VGHRHAAIDGHLAVDVDIDVRAAEHALLHAQAGLRCVIIDGGVGGGRCGGSESAGRQQPQEGEEHEQR